MQADTMTKRPGLSAKQIGRTFAAEVQGLDIATGLDADAVGFLEQGLGDFGVLVFRDQPLSDTEQQRLIEQFGQPAVPVLDAVKRKADQNPHFFDVATVDEDGNPLPPDSAKALYLLANKLWHTDGSQAQPPVRVSALSAQVLPSSPPPTEYADMRGAYDVLSDARKAEIDGLTVVHDILYSRAKLSTLSREFSEDTRKKRPPVAHPLVRTHPVTGRKSLYLASHASHIVGWEIDKGRALIDELTELATQPQFVYAHDWQPSDLVVWDDSWTMHRATEYEGTEPRIMRWGGALEPQAV